MVGGCVQKKLLHRRVLLSLAAWTGLIALSSGAEDRFGLDIRDRLSPMNVKRPTRPFTRYIVLHTTEGKEEGSLKKVRQRGEAHYFVGKNGRVYRIIQRSKIATHAGRSYWDGNKVIDNHSIGIEVVGYHDHDITAAQYAALAELLRQLQSLYDIPDRQILTHSMVAYGRPNQFHRYYHRGRKRCGMIFARPDVRQRLGVVDKPVEDPEVAAGHLRVADRELHEFLYSAVPAQQPAQSNVIARGWSAWTIAREKYDSPSTLYRFPNGKKLSGDQIRDWDQIPVGTRVEIGQPAPNVEFEGVEFEGFVEVNQANSDARGMVGDVFAEVTTIYFLPNGLVRTGEDIEADAESRAVLENLPPGTRILVGYIYGGHITRGRFPRQIAGVKWNYPSTFYRLPDGRILSGDEIDQYRIPRNTLVFYQS